MRHARTAVLTVIVCGSASAATSSDVSMFGLRLGQPLDIPECAVYVRTRVANGLIGYRKSYYLDYQPLKQGDKCFKRNIAQFNMYRDEVKPGKPIPPLPPLPDGPEKVSLCYSVDERPDVLSGDCAELVLIDRRLEGVTFPTPEPGSRDVVLDSLLKKFGKPSAVAPRKMQNVYGATHDATNYSWTSAGITILYDDMDGFSEGMQAYGTSGNVRSYQRRSGRVLVQSALLAGMLKKQDAGKPNKDEF